MKKDPIIIEQTFPVEAEKIWLAITSPKEMKLWYFDLPEFKPEVGATFQFSGGPSPDRQYVHLCEVKEVVKNEKISYTWKYLGYQGESLVTFLLTENQHRTTLKLIHSDLETFPQDNPDLHRNNFVEGWTSIIKTSLNNYLTDK